MKQYIVLKDDFKIYIEADWLDVDEKKGNIVMKRDIKDSCRIEIVAIIPFGYLVVENSDKVFRAIQK